MPCPHCRSAFEGAPETCPSCGLIFAKYAARSAAAGLPAEPSKPFTVSWPLLGALAVGLAAAFAFQPITRIEEQEVGWLEYILLLSPVNTAFHEGGHVVFGLLGLQFLTSAGGTLMQLLVPAACWLHFKGQDSEAGAKAAVYWLGANFVGISHYCADASRGLMLLIDGTTGAEGGNHDWGYMLGVLGLKSWSVGLGRLFFFTGFALMAYPLISTAQTTLFSSPQKAR